MTGNDVIKILKSHMEHDHVDMPTYQALGQAIAWLEDTCKVENRLSDEGTTTAWMNMPESPNDVFKRNVDESLNELNHKTMQCETEIDMLWNEIERLKERMPKEWL